MVLSLTSSKLAVEAIVEDREGMTLFYISSAYSVLKSLSLSFDLSR